MFDFSTATAVNIPEGAATSIAIGGTIVWQKETNARPLYPFVNGKWTYSNGDWIEITNGNHVHYKANNAKTYLNLSNIEQNTTDASDAANINNIPAMFTIPAGAECVLTVSNVSGYLNDANFRLANASASSTFFVGDSKNTTTASITTDSAIDIGCFFTYINKATECEFDITFTVNGEWWI